MDGPPTSIMYSPPAGGAAWTPSANIDKQQTSKRRFIICGEKDYLCGARNSQVVGRDRRARQVLADDLPQGRDSYQPGSISPRKSSSHSCRFRISANLSPQTNASAGSGREL